MRPLPVVIGNPSAEPGPQLGAGLECVQGGAFVFQRPPEPLDEDVVYPATAPVHADPHLGMAQHAGEVDAGELAARIRVEDLWPAEARQRFPQSLDAERRVHHIRPPPSEHLARRPVHNDDEVEEARRIGRYVTSAHQT